MTYFDENIPDIVLKSLFRKYDTDNKGTLSFLILPNLLEEVMGLSKEVASMYALLMAKDANGIVSYEEFKKWLKTGEKLNQVSATRYLMIERAVEMFKIYDRDGSGELDRSEFKQLHADVGGDPQFVDSALNSIDIDKDGNISFYEFLKWLNWIDMGSF